MTLLGAGGNDWRRPRKVAIILWLAVKILSSFPAVASKASALRAYSNTNVTYKAQTIELTIDVTHPNKVIASIVIELT